MAAAGVDPVTVGACVRICVCLVSPLKAVRHSEGPLLADEHAAADVSAGLALEGTLPRPATRTTHTTSQNPLHQTDRWPAPTVCGTEDTK